MIMVMDEIEDSLKVREGRSTTRIRSFQGMRSVCELDICLVDNVLLVVGTVCNSRFNRAGRTIGPLCKCIRLGAIC